MIYLFITLPYPLLFLIQILRYKLFRFNLGLLIGGWKRRVLLVYWWMLFGYLWYIKRISLHILIGVWWDNNWGRVNFILRLLLLWWWWLDITFFDLFYLFLFQLLLLRYQIFSQLIINGNWRECRSGWFFTLLLLIYLIGIDHCLDFKHRLVATASSIPTILLKRVERRFSFHKFIRCLFRFLQWPVEPKHVVTMRGHILRP